MGKHEAHHIRFTRYLLVGASANAIVLAVYWSLSLGVGLLPELSLTLASAFGLVLAYTANRIWSFNYRGDGAGSLVRYAVTCFTSYCIQLFVLRLGTDLLGYPHQWVVVFGVVLAIPVSYVLLAFFVFPPRTDATATLLERADPWNP